MPSGCVYEMFSDNVKCNKTYIGSTTGSLRARLASHKYARHPIFTFGDADVRVLEKDIPAGELQGLAIVAGLKRNTLVMLNIRFRV